MLLSANLAEYTLMPDTVEATKPTQQEEIDAHALKMAVEGWLKKPGKPFADFRDPRNWVRPGDAPADAKPSDKADAGPKAVPFMPFSEFCRQSVVEVVMSVRIQTVLGSYGDQEGKAAGHTVFSLLRKSYDACKSAYEEGLTVYGN